jgi:hypothetical protein
MQRKPLFLKLADGLEPFIEPAPEVLFPAMINHSPTAIRMLSSGELARLMGFPEDIIPSAPASVSKLILVSPPRVGHAIPLDEA